MQAQVTLTGDIKSITAVLAKLGGGGVVAEVAEVAEPKRGRGRPKKEVTPDIGDEDDDLGLGAAEEENEEADEVEASEDNSDDEEAEEETPEEESEPVTRKGATATKGGKAKAETLSLDDDIIPAFQKYAKKHSREKAAKIIAKFKAKKVQEISPKHYSEVLKLLTKG